MQAVDETNDLQSSNQTLIITITDVCATNTVEILPVELTDFQYIIGQEQSIEVIIQTETSEPDCLSEISL